MSLIQQLRTVYVFARLSTRRFFRDRLAMFFTIAFPLIFLFVFGGIFNSDNSDLSFKVALINQSQTAVASEFSRNLADNRVFKVKTDLTTLDAATAKMTRGELDAAIVIPADFGAIKASAPSGQALVYYTQNNQQAAQTLVSLLGGVFEGINSRYVSTARPFTVAAQAINKNSLSQFDYTFSGLLGFAIVGLGIFGPANVFPELKKQGILRRFSTTPLRVWQYFLSTALAQTMVGLLTMAIMFTVAVLVFKLDVVGNYLELAAYLAMSIVMILGIGLAIGGWASNERQAAPLSNIIVFPMMFLSGTFFPRFLMPDWLQHLSSVLPLTPVIDGIRLIATEGAHFTQLTPQLGLVLGWMVVIYLIAFRVFRWE